MQVTFVHGNFVQDEEHYTRIFSQNGMHYLKIVFFLLIYRISNNFGLK